MLLKMRIIFAGLLLIIVICCLLFSFYRQESVFLILAPFFPLFLYRFIEWVYDLNFQNPGKEISQQRTPKEMYVAKYEQAWQEVTRYRNLEWQIIAFSWAIYYGALSICKDRDCYHLDLSFPELQVFLCFAAICATIFLVFCEYSANSNRKLRRSLEEFMGLKKSFRFKPEGEDPYRFGSLVSMVIFLVFIWIPPFVFYLYA